MPAVQRQGFQRSGVSVGELRGIHRNTAADAIGRALALSTMEVIIVTEAGAAYVPPARCPAYHAKTRRRGGVGFRCS